MPLATENRSVCNSDLIGARAPRVVSIINPVEAEIVLNVSITGHRFIRLFNYQELNIPLIPALYTYVLIIVVT